MSNFLSQAKSSSASEDNGQVKKAVEMFSQLTGDHDNLEKRIGADEIESQQLISKINSLSESIVKVEQTQVGLF